MFYINISLLLLSRSTLRILKKTTHSIGENIGDNMFRLRVREVIQEKKITQSKLSRVADVPLNTIQVLYHNPEHDAKLSTLYRLAKALGVKIEDLYEVIPDEEEKQ